MGSKNKLKRFKENETFAHSYLLCRFDTCYLIDPSHDLEAIHQALNGRTLTGILITHAHQDHILDVEKLAKENNSIIISNF